MKYWNLRRTVGLPVGFEASAEVGGGGGSASAGGGAAPAGGAGVFASIPAVSLSDPGGGGAAAAGGDGGSGNAGDGAAAATTGNTGAAAAAVTNGAAAVATPDPLTTPFHAPILGRYKTWKETDEAFRNSQNESKRLADEVKQLRSKQQQEVGDRDTRLADLQAQLDYERKNGGFQELTEEALATLWKENPQKAYEYRAKLDKRNAEIKAEKENRSTRDRQRQEFEVGMRDKLAHIDHDMRSKPDQYPMYAELAADEGPMQAIVDMTRTGPVNPETGQRTSYLTGHEWTHGVLYLAALGRSYLKLAAEGKKVSAGAQEAARRTAAAAAAAGAGPAGGSHVGIEGGAKSDDQKYMESVISAGSQGVFGASPAKK